MAPKTEKQSFKKSSSYMKPHSVLSEKFKPLYYDFTSRSQGSTSDPNPPILKHPSSPVVEEGNISGSLPLVEEPIPLNLSTFDTNPLDKEQMRLDLLKHQSPRPDVPNSGVTPGGTLTHDQVEEGEVRLSAPW